MLPLRARQLAVTIMIAVAGTPNTAAHAQSAVVPESGSPSADAGPMLFITPFLSAGWSQTLGTPKAWKRTWGGYGSRVGDQFGFLIVEESVRRVVDHAVPWVDDRSPCVARPLSRAREVVVRAGCAVARTSTLRTASGDLRPNLPFLTGAAIGTVASLSWRPERRSAVSSRAFVAQRFAITYGATALARLLKDWRADAKTRR